MHEDFKRRTAYDIVKRDDIGPPAEYLPKSGRPTSFNEKNLKCLKYSSVNRVDVSQ